MTTPELLAGLRERGVILVEHGERLAFDAPAGALLPADQALLKDRKAEVLAVLRGDWCAAAGALLVRTLLAGRIGEDEFWTWEEWLNERAAIVEYQGDAGRAEADAIAYRLLADELNQTGL